MKALSHSSLRQYYKFVSSHINQTILVEKLLETEIISYDDMLWIYSEITDEYTEVFQWLVFNNFSELDYAKLVENNIPVIQSEYGVWVGITSFGSHYDLYVYPELIQAIFWADVSYDDIRDLW